MNHEQVILVDEQDNPIGTMDKQAAHISGDLHRAFSIFVYNSEGKLMLQRRALGKYHSGGLWTNTCCSHPRAGETLEEATHRRLNEEMGFDCALEHVFSFQYKAQVGDLIEHELDHVFFGYSDEKPEINPEEVEEWKMVDIETLQADIAAQPDDYTPWFKLSLKEVETYRASRRVSAGENSKGQKPSISLH